MNPETGWERYRFVLSSRWLGLIAFALIASVVTVLLGFWQWDRHHEKVARVASIDANWEAPVATIDDVLASGLAVSAADEWRRVALVGEFAEPGIAIRNRPMYSRPALLPTAVFLAERADGEVVAVPVNLGWIPAEEPVPALAEGPQRIEVRMRREEPPSGRDAPDLQAYNFNSSEILAAAGLQNLGVPVMRGWASVTAATEPLGVLPEPERTLGNHLSYAFQWWFFALAIPVGLVILARREAMDEFAMAVAGIGAPRHGRPTDEDIEDALVAEALPAPSQLGAAAPRQP